MESNQPSPAYETGVFTRTTMPLYGPVYRHGQVYKLVSDQRKRKQEVPLRQSGACSASECLDLQPQCDRTE